MIKDNILTIRNKQVILDKDLAKLYEVETKVLNQTVKRNIERFPKNFMFRLNKEEYNEILRSQIVTLGWGTYSKYLPYAFTEHGIVMLSSLLKSKKAIEVSIKIVNTFVEMRKIIKNNKNLFLRLDWIEKKLIMHDDKFTKLFDLMQPEKPKQKIFYQGQIFDAYQLIKQLLKNAKEITLIDNYINYETLNLLKHIKNITIYTQKENEDIKKFQQQYNLKLNLTNKYHDRFLIIDKEIYHIGASLKDLGKKCFAITKLKVSNIFE